MKPVHKCFILWHMLVLAYCLTSTMCECVQDGGDLVDLTHDFDNETIYWVSEPQLLLNVTYNGTLPGKDYWYQKEVMSSATHGGTHLDAPCHFAKGRWCVSDIPLSRFVVPAVVVDVRPQVGDDPNVHLTIRHLEEWERHHGRIPDNSVLLVNTGWSRFWPDPLAFTGTDRKKEEELKFPSILYEVAEWLITNRHVVGVGIDTMSIDPPGDYRTHGMLMERNVYGLENVANLDQLPPTGAILYVLPMKLKYASGAPCRILAKLPNPIESSGLRGVNSAGTLFCSYLSYILAVVLCAAVVILRL